MPRLAILLSITLSIPAAVHANAAETLDSAIERVRSDLAARHGARGEAIRTLSAKAAVWRDMSMGCGKPNESYAQVDVEGFHIILEYDGERFDYRARKDGQFVLCTTALRTAR